MIISKALIRAIPLCLMKMDRKPSCFRTLARSSSAQGPSKKAATVPRLPPRFGSKQAFRSRSPEAFVAVRCPPFLIFSCGHPCPVSRRSLRSRQQDGTVSDCIPLAKGAVPRLTTLVEITRIRQEVRELDVSRSRRRISPSGLYRKDRRLFPPNAHRDATTHGSVHTLSRILSPYLGILLVPSDNAQRPGL